MTRHKRSAPCPVCGGHCGLRHGSDGRCYGYDFTNESGDWTYCTNADHAGAAPYKEGPQAWLHRLNGNCRCGLVHGDGIVRPRLSLIAALRASIERRNEVYLDLLGGLTLSGEHADH